MLKTALLWGAPSSLPSGEKYQISYERSGKNFGNILIGNGVVSVLDGYRFASRSDFQAPEEVNEKCSHIIIPAANFLWKSFDFGYMGDFLERCTIPITMVGLGAQTNDRSRISEIHPNTLRMVKLISERSPSIGVRGYYTAEVLAANGILNTEVLGCPSLYTKLAPPSATLKWQPEQINALSVNFSRRVAGHAFEKDRLQAIENSLLKIAVANQLTFVAQDELEELSLSNEAVDENSIQAIKKYFSTLPGDDVVKYFKDHTQYFCNVDDWSSYIKNKSGSIGSRLHGNLIALINGVPSLTIAHDSRTLEMCALTGVPHVHIKDIEADIDIGNYLMDRLSSADFLSFNKNMSALFKRYDKFLRDHQLTNKLCAN